MWSLFAPVLTLSFLTVGVNKPSPLTRVISARLWDGPGGVHPEGQDCRRSWDQDICCCVGPG